MRLLMVDNYDSFTFNLVQYLGELGAAVDVVRNLHFSQKSAKMASESNKYNVMLEFSPGPRFASVLRMRFHEFLFCAAK